MQLFEQGADNNVIWTNQESSIGTGVTTVNMNNARHIIVYNRHASNTVSFTLDGVTPVVGTTFTIAAGASVSMDGLPAISSLKLIASGASTNVSILGW